MSHLLFSASLWLHCGFPADGKVLFRSAISLFPGGTLNLCVLTFRDIDFGCCSNDFHCLASTCLDSSQELCSFQHTHWEMELEKAKHKMESVR